MITLYFLIMLAGFAALIKGADIFVDGSSSLARYLKIPTLIIGLTLVAAGTSMPELAVSTSASISGADEIALSNVVGSNIFNLLGILGICALIYKLPVEKNILKRDFPVTLFSSLVVFIALALPVLINGQLFTLKMGERAGAVNRIFGIILLLSYFVYVAFLIFDARKNAAPENDDKKLPLWKSISFIILGLALVIAGGEAVVYTSQKIARFFGMTETFIGLTIVAIGTSLPELVTSLVAQKKGDTSLAIGNVVGSNIFNLLFILGVSATINPVSVNVASMYDLAVLNLANIFVFISTFRNKQIGRVTGMFMIILYVAETVFAILR